jgi:hypothetical protein
MNNIQEILLFPVRDVNARRQFLIACLVVLAGFFIPILPSLVLLGYSAKIMRQITEERQKPSMPAWQGSDVSEMLMDGLRLWGAQLVLMLPLFLLMGCGAVSILGGSIGISALADKSENLSMSIGVLLLMTGVFMVSLLGILALPYSFIVYASQPHVARRRSFEAVFQFREWFAILRQALGQYILGYVIVMAASFVFVLVMQIAMMTIILLCIIPLLMAPYMAYQILIMNTVFARAYAVGRERLETA